ncbi:MAG: MmgE/PrpD family protein [Hyphomicrobiaceae bacterium]
MSDAAKVYAGERLGRFIAETRLEDLSETVRHQAKRSLLNFMGGAAGVAADPAVETAVHVLTPFSGPATATLIGRREKMDAMCASFVNAVSSNLLDYDDTHLNTVIHPTAPVAPPVLALAEQRGLSGADALLAFALGAEVECRLGNSVSGHYARGWHITATCGVFGAAAATSRLLKLTPQQTWHALGIAASQSGSLVENLPSAAKSVGMGNAARNGLFAALLAEQGYTAAPAAIEGKHGWARATGDAPNLDELLGELGTRWELAKNTYKPYPCGIVMHSIIDACLQLRSQSDLKAEDVASVVVRGDALLLARGDRIVRNERDAKVSIHHSVAAPLIWGRGGVKEFSEAAVSDPAARTLREKVRAELDSSFPTGASQVIVQTNGGQTLETTVVHAHGSLENPLSDAEIEAKVRDLAAMGKSGCDMDGIIKAMWALEKLPNVAALMAMAAARPA